MPQTALVTFHVMAKPAGASCNLQCRYCFYLEKEKLYGSDQSRRMSDEVLESYIRQYIQQQNGPEVSFAWQGGEPTLLGVDFFRKVVALQQRYADGRTISNALQTNGTLLDDAWCEFLTQNKFLVGLSIDGPRELHDCYRRDRKQEPTFDAVLKGLKLLKKHGTEFNTLTVVSRANSQKPLEVYRFLKEIGSGFVQFIPLVERQETPGSLAGPPVPGHATECALPVAPWSVEPAAYGEFLCAIYDQWVHHDVGQVFVQLFDVALGSWMGLGAGLCVFGQTCGKAMALEHNGDLYACDHYVYPEFRLGNLLQQPLEQLVNSAQQTQFGEAKRATLSSECRTCRYCVACNGDCPKHRFVPAADGRGTISYLCPAYKRFFEHIDPTMQTMARLLRARQPAAAIMRMLAEQRQERRPAGRVGRNDLCPCGSGRKYKRCCGSGISL